MVQFLADYFAVINTKEDDIPQDWFLKSSVRWNRSGGRCPMIRNLYKVKFRIPEKDISKENPFPEGTELFAMPNGWQLFDQWQPCSFHSVQLTKIDGSAYWASFFNYFYLKEKKYYPTSLVLISRKVSNQTTLKLKAKAKGYRERSTSQCNAWYWFQAHSSVTLGLRWKDIGVWHFAMSNSVLVLKLTWKSVTL